MKIKHKIIFLISVSFMSIPVILQPFNQTDKTHKASESILKKNEESFIFEAPEYLIEEKSSLSSAYILLTCNKVPVYNYPSGNASPTDYIREALKISILESTEEWYKILYNEKTGYVLKKHTTVSEDEALKASAAFKQPGTVAIKTSGINQPSVSEKGQEVVECAKKYLGVKYVYGGSSPSGFDCSGLVQYVCKSVGIPVSRTAASQFNNGKAVNKDELIPGDLLFFAKNGRIHHVGIYAGDGRMIHAPHTGDVVKFSDFNTPYRQREFVGARRVF